MFAYIVVCAVAIGARIGVNNWSNYGGFLLNLMYVYWFRCGRVAVEWCLMMKLRVADFDVGKWLKRILMNPGIFWRIEGSCEWKEPGFL